MIKPRKAVLEMDEYNPPTAGREDYIRLDFNENAEGCSQKALDALRKIKAGTLAAYPEYSKLTKELAKYCNVREDEILPTNATDEAIKTIIETYAEKGKDEIIIPTPTFAMFKFYAQLNEALIKEVLYNDDLSFPTSKVLNSINKKTKIVILVNPNNPTGTSIKDEDITKIIEKAKNNEALVFIDEAYWQFYGKTSIPLIKKYDNLIVTQTFSKAFGLAGLRLGYIVSNKENIKNMAKALSPYSVNAAAISCGLASLNDAEYANNYAKEVSESKKIIYDELEKLKIKYYPSDANFVLLKLGKNSGIFCRKMKESGILVRDRSSDPLLEGCVRITLGTKEQTKKLISAIESSMKEINPLLIFDIDGVLVDTSKSYRVAIKKTVEHFTEKETSLQDVQALKNMGGYNNDWDASEALIKLKGKTIGKQEIIDKFQEIYRELRDNEPWLLDKELLESLSRRYKMAVFTGRIREEAEYVLRKNNARKYFESIIAMEDVVKRKPNPEGILKIMNGSKDAYYFGDMVDDMRAAASANITGIGVLPPQDKSKEMEELLIANGAKMVLDDINKITETIK
ncbi:MAG: histidinol-phosphate transaminase [Nanoarchaeota archaeon]